jgi:hypothetical protein
LQAEKPCDIDVASLLEGSRGRQFFQLSLHNRDMNREYAEMYFKKSELDAGIILGQLDDFLQSRPDLEGHPKVSRIRNDYEMTLATS